MLWRCGIKMRLPSCGSIAHAERMFASPTAERNNVKSKPSFTAKQFSTANKGLSGKNFAHEASDRSQDSEISLLLRVMSRLWPRECTDSKLRIGSALALSQLLISFFQITESLRQRSDIGRGRCDSKAAPFPYRWASADQTNCSRVLCGPPSFFMSTSVEHFPCPPVNFGSI